MFIFEAENIEAVKKIIENDIYYTSGVVSVIALFEIVLECSLYQWDPERIVILPFAAATPIP